QPPSPIVPGIAPSTYPPVRATCARSSRGPTETSAPSRILCGRTGSDMSTTPHPYSFFHFDDRVIELKVHRCLWSGTYSETSPLAIEECAREAVVRAEIDVQLLRDGEFVIFHDDRFDRVTDARCLVREATARESTRARFHDRSDP